MFNDDESFLSPEAEAAGLSESDLYTLECSRCGAEYEADSIDDVLRAREMVLADNVCGECES